MPTGKDWFIHKGKLTSFLLGLSVLVSCSEKPKPESFVPKEVEWVLRADLQWVALEFMQLDKDSTSSASSQEAQKESLPSSQPKLHPLINILSNPLTSGLNVFGDIWIYSQVLDSIRSNKVALLGLSSVNSFEDRLKENNITWQQDDLGLRSTETDGLFLQWNTGVLAVALSASEGTKAKILSENKESVTGKWFKEITESNLPSNIYVSGPVLASLLGDSWQGEDFIGSISLSSRSIHVEGQFGGSGASKTAHYLLNKTAPSELLRTIPSRNVLKFATIFSVKETSADSLLTIALTALGVIDSTDQDNSNNLFNLWDGQVQYVRLIDPTSSPYAIKAGTKTKKACEDLITTYYNMGALSKLNATEYSLAGLYNLSCDGSYLNWQSQQTSALSNSEKETIKPYRAYVFARTPYISEAFWGKIDSTFFNPIQALEIDWVEFKIPESLNKQETTLRIELTLGFYSDLRSLVQKKIAN